MRFNFCFKKVCVCVCDMWDYPMRPKEGIESSGTEVKGSCESPGVNARDPTQILWENSRFLTAEPWIQHRL